MADKIKVETTELEAFAGNLRNASRFFDDTNRKLLQCESLLDNSFISASAVIIRDMINESIGKGRQISDTLSRFSIDVEKAKIKFINADNDVSNNFDAKSAAMHKKESSKKTVSTRGKISHGAKIGSSIFKIAGGVFLVGTSGAEEFFTGGTASGFAIPQAAYGVNSIANGIRDLHYCYDGDYKEVGKKDYLKDFISSGTESITGTAFNNKTAGKAIGSDLYDAGDMAMGARGFGSSVGVMAGPKYIKIGKLPYEVGRFGSNVKIAYNDVIVEGPSMLKRVVNAKDIISTIYSEISDGEDIIKNTFR